MKNSLKQLVAPISIFETLGLKYGGPIDGHDLQAVEKALRDAARIRGPVVVHVVTNKGQGYGPAVADKVDKFHGVSTFDPDSGAAAKKGLDWTDVFGEALCEAAESDERIVAITAAMASSTGLLEFSQRFPDRFFDVGHRRAACGDVRRGARHARAAPVVCIYSTFLQRAFDQVACDVALHRLPVTFVIDRAGITGADGPSHHGISTSPTCAASRHDHLGAQLDPTSCAGCLPPRSHPTGRSHCVFRAAPHRTQAPSRSSRSGAERGHRATRPDLALFAVGKMVAVAMQAREKLLALGISTTVVDARFVKPLAPELSSIAARHRAVITVEDGVASGGFGTAVTELLSSDGITVPIVRMGLPDRFIEHGAQARAARAARARRGRGRRRGARPDPRDRGARGLTGSCRAAPTP